MQLFSPPQLSCLPLLPFDENDWKSVESAFADTHSCELRQAWRESPEPEFQPARVRVGHREDALWVYAELSDCDIFNDATHLNDATYAKGDLFEVLVRPGGQDDYYEFHVTPENHILQLHWPDADAVWGCVDTQESIGPYFVPGVLLQSRTQVQREKNFWRVLADVPFSIAREGSARAGDVWTVSFSRYDFTRGRSEPVLSSCSPHAQPRFHRQQEWGRMTFAE